MAKSEIKKALKEVCEELGKLSYDELMALLDKHKDGDITRALLELEEFYRSDEFKKIYQGGSHGKG